MTKPIIGALLSLFAIAGCGPAKAADVTLRVTHEMAAQDAINIAAMRFAERVAERTGGLIDVKVFPAAQLGHDNDSLEQIKLGADLIVITQMAAAAPSEVPDLTILDGPYLYDDLADYRKLIASDWFASQEQKLEQAGVKVLAANWLFGVRHTLADRPLRTPEDMQGLNIRIPPLAMWVETFEALGANGQTINFGEAYTALSSGVVDAIESPLESLWAAKFYETQNVISMTGHFTNWIAPMMSAQVFAELPAETQQILLEEAEIGGEIITALALDREQGLREKLQAAGITFVDEVDHDAFREKTRVVYEQFKEWTPGLYDTVRGAMNP
jgi:tripartite ATP-independent transporter DctP family solute receptor